MTIYMIVNFAIIKKMYENLTDKQVIIDCGKELNRDGKFNAMIINITLLSIAMDELNDKNKPCLTQMRVIEHWVGWNRKLENINETRHQNYLKKKLPIYIK